MRHARGTLVALLIMVAAACTGGSDQVSGEFIGTSAPASTPAPDVPSLVRRAIEAFNSTAGGPVATQQAHLRRLTSSGQLAVQHKCPPATSTVTFEPVYARLAAVPNWRPTSGSLPGVVYALPSLIHIYTGSRIVGTDLTELRLAVDGGEVRLAALCLR